MRPRARMLAVAVAMATLVVVAPARAHAAGIVTHAWMADEAIDRVADTDLRALLRTHADQVRAGAEFPDGGYLTRDQGVPGGDYGEEAHWQRFLDAYADRIRARGDCGDLRRPDGPCAPQVAHLMGVAAHSMGDQVWDWLFEPQAPDHGESFIPPELAGLIGPGGIEVQMDVVAIVDHGRPTGPTPDEPSRADLVAAFAAAGRPGITEEAIGQGKAGLQFLRTLEANGAPTYHDALVAAMPWTSANVETAPGGVRFAAGAIAALLDTLWGRLLGEQPATRVAATYPEPGQADIPATGWLRDPRPGSHPDGGGARTRIAAALSYALPYVPAAGGPDEHVPAELPAGAMRLVEQATGADVPLRAGYPRLVPYSPDPGGHLIDLQPATDLEPCTEYRVEVTDRLRDAAERPVVPASWAFRTACPPSFPGLLPLEPAGGPPPPGDVPLAASPVPIAPRFAG